MQDVIKLVAEYGVSLVIVALFLWDWFTNRKENNKALQEMSVANSNTSRSLGILEKNQTEQTKILIEIKQCLENEKGVK